MNRLRPSPAFALACVALLVALGSTAYAALVVTGKNVKNGSLTGADVKDGSLRGADVRPGAGLRVRFIASTYFQSGHTLASGDALCPKGSYAIGGGVSGFGSDDPAVTNLPGEQLVNASFPLDEKPRDGKPERYVGFVYNSSAKRLNFEVDAVCAPAASASSNFGRAGATRQRAPRGAVRATRIRSANR